MKLGRCMLAGLNDNWVYHSNRGWSGGAKVSWITSPGRLTDTGLQLGIVCYPCSR